MNREMHFYELEAILKGLEMFIDLWNIENFEKRKDIGFSTSFCFNNISFKGERGHIMKDSYLEMIKKCQVRN